MVYELDCDAARLSLRISAAVSPSERWQVEAALVAPSRPDPLRAEGASRDEALLAVRDAWNERGEAGGYRALNWQAIHDAMAAVRGV